MKIINAILLMAIMAIGCSSSKSINNMNMKAFTVDQINAAHSKVHQQGEHPLAEGIHDDRRTLVHGKPLQIL